MRRLLALPSHTLLILSYFSINYLAQSQGSGLNAHAYRIAQHIGVQKIRQQCPHFDGWMAKLEQIQNS
jgi:hypothetical protein